MLNNYKEGHFVISRETAKDPAVMANLATRQALFYLYDQKPYQDVTATLRRKTVLEQDGMAEYRTPFVDWVKTANRRITVTEDKIRYRKTSKARPSFRVGRTFTGTTTPGLRREMFEIVLTTDVFKPGDKIGPCEGWQFLLVVQSMPRPTGQYFAYTVQHTFNNPDAFFPVAYLKEGVKFEKRGSSNYSEGSLDWGSTLWQKGYSVLTWEVGLFKTGKEFKITDDALKHVFKFDPMVGNQPYEGLPKSFMSDVELNMMIEAEAEMEQDLVWGQYNHSIVDTSTNLPRKIGAGIFDFISAGHINDYSPTNFGIRELVDWQEDVWENTVGQIVYGTGKPGLSQIDKSIKYEFGENAVIRDYEHFIERSGVAFPGGPEAWKLKRPVFNAYELETGGVVMFELWPWLDRRDENVPKHPKTGKPLLGYHYIGSRFAGKGPESNTVLVNRANSEIWGYENGAVGPYGPINDKSGGKYVMTHSGRYATLRHGNEYGLFVEDVNDFIWHRPNIR